MKSGRVLNFIRTKGPLVSFAQGPKIQGTVPNVTGHRTEGKHCYSL